MAYERKVKDKALARLQPLLMRYSSEVTKENGGGLLWLNGGGSFPAPKDAYYIAGVGGQNVLIIPSHQLAVVRLGHYKGVAAGGRALRKAVEILMEAVSPVDGSNPGSR